MSWLSMVGGMGQGIIGAWGSRKAGKAHGKAYKKAMAWLQQALGPYMTFGQEYGINKLADLLEAGPGEFTESPGYQFRLGEGTKALERSAAAKGGLLGGATGKALQQYGQEYATGEYQNFLNRYYQKLQPYFQAANIGMGALGYGVNTMPGLITGKGAVQGAYMQNAANALGSMFGGMGGMGGMGRGGGGGMNMNQFAQMYPSTYSGSWYAGGY